MAVSSVFNLLFIASDRGTLGKMRNIIKGVGQESYKTFNAISRSMSTLDKVTGKSLGKFATLLGGGGFMAMGIKGLNYSLVQSNSLIKTNTILLEEVIGNKGKAREMVSVIQEVAGTYGQDISELMTASRGVVQVMRQVDRGVSSNQLQRMLKMIMTVSALDTENRGLAYTAFSFKEAFQGIGQQDWKSMMNRLEINIGRTYQESITKAIKAGNLEKALSLLEEGLTNIGLDSNKVIGRLMAEGLIQNVARTTSYVNRFFQMLGEKGFESITRPFVGLNLFLSKQFQMDSAGYRAMVQMSQNIDREFIKPIVEKAFEVGRAFQIIGSGKIFNNFIRSFKNTLSIFSNLVSIPFKFVRGLFGINDSFNTVFDTVTNINKGLEKFGNFAGKVAEWLSAFKKPVLDFGLAINDLVVTLLKLSGVPFAVKTGEPVVSSIIRGGLKLGEVSVKGIDRVIELLAQERKTVTNQDGQQVEIGGGTWNKIVKGAGFAAMIIGAITLIMKASSTVAVVKTAATVATTAARSSIIAAATVAATAAATAVMGVGAVAGNTVANVGAGVAGEVGGSVLGGAIAGASAGGGGAPPVPPPTPPAGGTGLIARAKAFLGTAFNAIKSKLGLAVAGVGTAIATMGTGFWVLIGIGTILAGTMTLFNEKAGEMTRTAELVTDTELSNLSKLKAIQSFYDKQNLNPLVMRRSYDVIQEASKSKIAGAEGITDPKVMEAIGLIGILKGGGGFADQLKSLVEVGGLPALRKIGVKEDALKRQYGGFYDIYRDTSFDKETGLGKIINQISVDVKSGAMSPEERNRLIQQLIMVVYDKVKVTVDDSKTSSSAGKASMVADYFTGSAIGG